MIEDVGEEYFAQDKYGDSFNILEVNPYGKVGDRLWVRETWATVRMLNNTKPSLTGIRTPFWYKDGDSKNLNGLRSEIKGRWRPSIHMPRWASRITLEITNIRVERVRDITINDIEAEGYQHELERYASENWPDAAWGWFEMMWDSINANRGYGWEVNPWVWVVSFKVVK